MLDNILQICYKTEKETQQFGILRFQAQRDPNESLVIEKGVPIVSFVKWEKKRFKDFTIFRTKVAGGWLVWVNDRKSGGLNFYSDPQHKWDLTSHGYMKEKE